MVAGHARAYYLTRNYSIFKRVIYINSDRAAHHIRSSEQRTRVYVRCAMCGKFAQIKCAW